MIETPETKTPVSPLAEAKLALRRKARNDFSVYIRYCDPTYQLEAMHRRIAQELTKVETGETKRLIISAPPRHGKSVEVAQEWPTYMLGRYPALKFIVATHTNELAKEHSDNARNRMRHPVYHELFDTRVRDDSSAKKHWRTHERGGYHTAGVTVKIGGFGADILIVDDMFADYADAHSPTKREAVSKWFDSTAQMRLSPDGKIIVISTRWHVDDLIGRLIDPANAARAEMLGVQEDISWRVLNLPAFAERDDPLGRAIGEPLCPIRWPREKLLQRQAKVEDHVFNSLFQGRPTIMGGNYLRTENLEFINEEQIPPGQRWMRAWDFATSENQDADFTAGAKGCITPDGTFIIAHIKRFQFKWPETQDCIAEISERERIPFGGEANGQQEALCDMLQKVIKCQPIQKLYPESDKVIRCGEWAVALKNKKVLLVRPSATTAAMDGGDWTSAFVAEAESFPRGKNDDQVDAVSYLFKMLDSGPGAAVIAPAGREWNPVSARGGSRILI